MVTLKSTCLKVYALYSKREITKEGDLPYGEKETFKRVFDKKQPRLCRKCGKEVKGSGYCFNAKCVTTHQNLKCKTCNTPATVRNNHLHCKTCDRGGKPIPAVDDSHPFLRNLKRNRETLNHLCDTFFESAEDHEPAWKKRR